MQAKYLIEESDWAEFSVRITFNGANTDMRKIPEQFRREQDRVMSRAWRDTLNLAGAKFREEPDRYSTRPRCWIDYGGQTFGVSFSNSMSTMYVTAKDEASGRWYQISGGSTSAASVVKKLAAHLKNPGKSKLGPPEYYG